MPTGGRDLDKWKTSKVVDLLKEMCYLHECDVEAVKVTDGVNPETGAFVSEHKPELQDLYDEAVSRLSNEFTVIGHRDDLS